jgi:hypothetical protein
VIDQAAPPTEAEEEEDIPWHYYLIVNLVKSYSTSVYS